MRLMKFILLKGFAQYCVLLMEINSIFNFISKKAQKTILFNSYTVYYRYIHIKKHNVYVVWSKIEYMNLILMRELAVN